MTNVEILYNVLMSDNVVNNINENLDKILLLIPELKHEIGFDHNHPHHHLDVWNHTLLALSMASFDFDIRLALLLHDIGKPFSYQDEEGIRHFHGHSDESEKMTRRILKRLGFNKNKIKDICYLIKNHDLPITEKDLKKYPELSLKRYEIQKCDALAHHPDKLEKRINYLNEVKEKIKKI